MAKTPVITTEPTVLRQYRMTTKNADRVTAEAALEEITVIEWLADHFDTYFVELDAWREKQETRKAARRK
jgi:hypothetical protein